MFVDFDLIKDLFKTNREDISLLKYMNLAGIEIVVE